MSIPEVRTCEGWVKAEEVDSDVVVRIADEVLDHYRVAAELDSPSGKARHVRVTIRVEEVL